MTRMPPITKEGDVSAVRVATVTTRGFFRNHTRIAFFIKRDLLRVHITDPDQPDVFSRIGQTEWKVAQASDAFDVQDYITRRR